MLQTHFDQELPMRKALKPTDSLTVQEFADIFGFTIKALIAAIEKQRMSLPKPFYSVQDLAARWCCTQQNIHNILRRYGVEVLDLTMEGKSRGRTIVFRDSVERIE
jgi:hypothetical protein